MFCFCCEFLKTITNYRIQIVVHAQLKDTVVASVCGKFCVGSLFAALKTLQLQNLDKQATEIQKG